MSNTCIPKEDAAKLRAVIDGGDVSVQELKDMPSAERLEFFSKYTNQDIAKRINLGFEKRMNSKTKDILENYIERELTKTSAKVKENLTEKLTKMEDILAPEQGDAFLDELVAHKIGAHIEPSVAERMLKFAEKAQDLRAKMTDTTTPIRYGAL